MLPSLRSHEEYINFVSEHLIDVAIPEAHKDVVDKLKLLDLTGLRLLFIPLYCLSLGRIGFAPEDLIVLWRWFSVVLPLRVNGFQSIFLIKAASMRLSVAFCLPIYHPSDACMTLWVVSLIFLNTVKKITFVTKGKGLAKNKRNRDDKEKVTQRHVKIVSKLAKRFARIADNNEKIVIPHAEEMVNDIINLCCVSESQRRKLLDTQNLSIASDGSKIPTHGKRYGQKVCHCPQRNCDCPRFYNDKDASIGYDAYAEWNAVPSSTHDTFVFGYNFYQLSSFSLKHNYELPVYLTMATGGRHDAPVGMFAMHRATQVYGYNIQNACFDAAHDATEFYMMGKDYWETNFFIPLNSTNSGNLKNLPMAYIDAEGIPHCQAEHEMYYSGHCKDRDRIKWRCPIKASKKGESLKCDYIAECSPSQYGRVVYTHPADNPRLYPNIPRNSQKWQQHYDKRTSVERVFKREKNDFKLTSFKTRCKERMLFYALLTAMAVHVEAWIRQDREKEQKAE